MRNFSMNKQRIFFLTLVLSFIFQIPVWSGPYVLDMERWASQGQYVAEDDIRQYDVSAAYGHPGGPIILGVIGAHEFFGAPYTVKTLVYVLAFMNSVLIALSCVLCFILRKKWWLGAFVGLAMSRMYFYATPPSALSALLIVFLTLLTLFIYERKGEVRLPIIFLWSLVAGLSIATRFDLGIFTTSIFFIFMLVQKNFWTKWRIKFVLLFLYTILAFILFNPFMWFMPIQHLQDLFTKALYHYAKYAETLLPNTVIFDFSWLSAIAFFIFLSMFLYKDKAKSVLPVPASFIFMVFGLTISLYVIFLSSSYQAVRYFIPVVLIWELILPLLLLSLPGLVPQSNKNQMLAYIPFALFVFFQAGLFIAFILL